MIILIDMDEVLCDFLGSLLTKYNRRHATEFTVNDFTEWDMPDDMVEIYMDNPLMFFYLKPLPGAIVSMKALMRNHDVYIVTNPSGNLDILTNKWKWVRMHLPEFDMDRFCAFKDKQLINADIIFDDCPDYLKRRRGIITVAMDRPYNREVDANYRVKGWSEFMAVVRMTERQLEWNGYSVPISGGV